MRDSYGYQVGIDQSGLCGENVIEASIAMYIVSSQGEIIWIF
jgi:hypothetical protein